MSNLNDLISSAEDEHINREKRVLQKTVRRPVFKYTIWIIQLLVATVVFVFCVSQFIKVMPWFFGIPSDTTQDDLVILLNHTREGIEQIREEEGMIPDNLPAYLQVWLIEYSKQEDDYIMKATIDNVTVELSQIGSKTIIKKYRD